MAFASSSRLQLAYIKETVFGQVPVVGTGKSLRITDESFNFNLTKEVSKELNANRAPTAMIPTKAEASGSVNFELSYAEYDPLFEGVLQSAFAPYGTNGVGATFSATFTPTTITAGTAPTGSSDFTTLLPGQWFTIRGSGTANDNKLFRVHATTPVTTTVITLDPGTPATAGSGATTSVCTSRLTNGTVQPSFSIERNISDVGEYFLFTGMTPSSMKLNIATGAITTGEVAFMGANSTRGTVTSMPGGTTTPSKSYNVMSAVSGTSCALWANGAPLTGTFVSSVAMSYDNTLRSQSAICSLGPVGIGTGSINATFTLEVYFASGAFFYSQFIANTNMPLAFTAFDTNGNGYVFTLPKANISKYDIKANGNAADVMVSLDVTALLDSGNVNPALRKVMFIDRMGDAVVP